MLALPTIAVRAGRRGSAAHFSGTPVRGLRDPLSLGSHNTRRCTSPATAVRDDPAKPPRRVPMPFLDSAIQFLGFDGRRKCESLWRRKSANLSTSSRNDAIEKFTEFKTI
jgi:hypothetical protein